mmetsp:Transcript_16890/g.34769  ORF Transcript_16890/g.34769 Transcript_16890/m.34769 type:complete len:233 (+) Transcript_16890:46-744(+)
MYKSPASGRLQNAGRTPQPMESRTLPGGFCLVVCVCVSSCRFRNETLETHETKERAVWYVAVPKNSRQRRPPPGHRSGFGCPWRRRSPRPGPCCWRERMRGLRCLLPPAPMSSSGRHRFRKRFRSPCLLRSLLARPPSNRLWNPRTTRSPIPPPWAPQRAPPTEQGWSVPGWVATRERRRRSVLPTGEPMAPPWGSRWGSRWGPPWGLVPVLPSPGTPSCLSSFSFLPSCPS